MFKTDIKQIFTPEDSGIILNELTKSYNNFRITKEHGDLRLSVEELPFKELKNKKIKSFIDQKMNDLSSYLGERVTEIFFLKYDSSTETNKMDAHYDGATRSVLIYLNNDFEGGGTKFTFTGYIHSPQDFQPGHALIYNSNSIFSHHEGMVVTEGVKWVLVCRSLEFTPLRLIYFLPYRFIRDVILDRIILRTYLLIKNIFIKK